MQMDLIHMLDNVCDEMSQTRTTAGHQLCVAVSTTLRKDVWFFQPTLCKRNNVVAPVCNARILILVLCIIILLLALLCIFCYFLYILLHRYVQKSCNKL